MVSGLLLRPIAIYYEVYVLSPFYDVLLRLNLIHEAREMFILRLIHNLLIIIICIF